VRNSKIPHDEDEEAGTGVVKSWQLLSTCALLEDQNVLISQARLNTQKGSSYARRKAP
jgi:hypothetical protein